MTAVHNAIDEPQSRYGRLLDFRDMSLVEVTFVAFESNDILAKTTQNRREAVQTLDIFI